MPWNGCLPQQKTDHESGNVPQCRRLAKSIKLAGEQTQRDLQQSYLIRAAMEADKT